MNSMKMYQVSTLQALMLGYSRAVIPVSELLNHLTVPVTELWKTVMLLWQNQTVAFRFLLFA